MSILLSLWRKTCSTVTVLFFPKNDVLVLSICMVIILLGPPVHKATKHPWNQVMLLAGTELNRTWWIHWRALSLRGDGSLPTVCFSVLPSCWTLWGVHSSTWSVLTPPGYCITRCLGLSWGLLCYSLTLIPAVSCNCIMLCRMLNKDLYLQCMTTYGSVTMHVITHNICIGRVLNRMSKDVGFLDDKLPQTFLDYSYVC